MFNPHIKRAITSPIIALLITACGGSSPTYLMGGSIQGAQVSLSALVQTVAGGAELVGSVDGEGSNARFSYPWGMTTDGANLYISEANSIRMMNIASGYVATLAGSPDSNGYADGKSSDARFFVPRGITTDGQSVYVVDSYNSTIRRIDIDTGAVSTLAGKAGVNGIEDGIGEAARFNIPGDLTTDGENLYVTEPYSHTVRKIVIATREVTTISGMPGMSGTDDGIGADARFDSPFGITTDGRYLYIACPPLIRRISIADRTVTTLASHADGSTSTQFRVPAGLATDGFNLYVTESNRTVQKLSLEDGQITTIAGNATQLGTTDGPGTTARFNHPIGITTNGRSLYVADTNNHTIRRIN